MSRGAQLRVSRTKSIPVPNEYIQALYGEFGPYCLDEEAAPGPRGQWRKEVFSKPETMPLDLEIGTGNGSHFAHQAQSHPERMLVGIELKYKPLIQSIRRARRLGCENARMVRYNASLVDRMFVPGEIDNVYIHFPDPWPKGRQQKHRLLQTEFLQRLFSVQKPGAWVEFKTDNRDYFDWALERIKNSPYQLHAVSFDLHHSEWAEQNFVTQFESIFLREGLPIHMARLIRGDGA